MAFADTLRARTFVFAASVVTFCRQLPDDWLTREISRQLLKAGTSVGANYRSACRARSRREFIAKLGIAVEEADETAFWLDLLETTQLSDGPAFEALRAEAREVLAVLSRSHLTSRENLRQSG